MADLLKFVQDEFVAKKDFPVFGAGDTITVYYEIKEGEKTRTQFFKGVVIQRRGSGNTETFTIRKMSGTVGVERIFPVNLPALQKIEINKKGKVRRARIFYFRELTGKKAKIKEVRGR
jgi:large subunit ribosomal protein L19